LTAARLKKEVQSLPSECGGVFDAVIVGGGVSGLACAASLARIGYRCCVLEQGETLGGGAHVFTEHGGYEFETGLHYLGKDVDMDKILDFLTCGRLKLASYVCMYGTA
jgi:phytoene dehydrogenase-like protein